MSFSSDNPLLINQLPITIEFDKDNERLPEQLTQWAKSVANSSNSKTGGLYSPVETGNSEQYIISPPDTTSNVYRKVFDMVDLNGGAIAAGATVNFAHGITGLRRACLIYANLTSAANEFFSIMYPNTYLTATDVYLVNPLGGTALTYAYVVAEYIKT